MVSFVVILKAFWSNDFALEAPGSRTATKKSLCWYLSLKYFCYLEDIAPAKMKFNHNNIVKTLSDAADVQDEDQTEDKRLDQAEVALGDHVTGGVVQSWRQVQMRLVVLSEGECLVEQSVKWCFLIWL